MKMNATFLITCNIKVPFSRFEFHMDATPVKSDSSCQKREPGRQRGGRGVHMTWRHSRRKTVAPKMDYKFRPYISKNLNNL
jgi:hypothetical protein